jgi:hypothetical protein
LKKDQRTTGNKTINNNGYKTTINLHNFKFFQNSVIKNTRR